MSRLEKSVMSEPATMFRLYNSCRDRRAQFGAVLVLKAINLDPQRVGPVPPSSPLASPKAPKI